MTGLDRRVFLRLLAIVGGIALAAAALLGMAGRAGRQARSQIDDLARTEIQADELARQFRGMVDDLHSSLLLLGHDPAPGPRETINRLRDGLNAWARDRLARAKSPEEKTTLGALANEVAIYSRQIDGVLAPASDRQAPLTREQVIMFDDAAVRLQSLADENASLHLRRLKQTLRASLDAMTWLRDLVYGCLGLLAGALLVLGVILYRDLVRPLQLMVVDRDQALARGEKLAALGTLAAGVAHEIRNPLTAMKARLYALRRASVDDVVRDDLTAVQHDIDRLERIVRDVLDFARPAEARFAAFDLAAWAREVTATLQPEMTAAEVALEVEASEPVVVRGDAGHLRQVALNLARNSREAFEGRPGRITFSVRQEQLAMRGRHAPAAVFAVTDNGPGIPAEVRARLFDPFFTTKASGTGLGLAIVARIVEAHGGEIALQTAPDGGTRFEIRLSLASAAAAVEESRP